MKTYKIHSPIDKGDESLHHNLTRSNGNINHIERPVVGFSHYNSWY